MADVTLNSLNRTQSGKPGLMAQFRVWMQKRANYHRTLTELESLDRRTLNDLGIAPADFRRIARQEAYKD